MLTSWVFRSRGQWSRTAGRAGPAQLRRSRGRISPPPQRREDQQGCAGARPAHPSLHERGAWPRYGAWPATASLGAGARQVSRLPRGCFRIRWRPLDGQSAAAPTWLAGGLADWRLFARARRCWGASLGPRSARRRATRRGLCPRRPPSTSPPRARTPSMMVRNTEFGGLPRPRPPSSSGPQVAARFGPRPGQVGLDPGRNGAQRCSVEGGRAVWIRRARIETVVYSPLDRFPFCSAVFLCGLGATDAPGCFPSGCFPAPEPRGLDDALDRCKLVSCNLADPMALSSLG